MRAFKYEGRTLCPLGNCLIYRRRSNRICHAKSPTSLFSLFIYIRQSYSATPEYQSNFYSNDANLTQIQVYCIAKVPSMMYINMENKALYMYTDLGRDILFWQS